MSRAPYFWRVWRIPMLLAGLTLFGLFAALLGTGGWHWFAWLALAVPIAVGIRYWMIPHRPR